MSSGFWNVQLGQVHRAAEVQSRSHWQRAVRHTALGTVCDVICLTLPVLRTQISTQFRDTFF